MKDYRAFVRACVGLLLLFLFNTALSACAFPFSFTGTRDAHEVVYWTTATDPIGTRAQEAVIAAFEKQNPDLHVRIVGMPAQGTGDATSLITAVRGGSPPDVYMIDRFTVSQQASIGLLKNIAPEIAKDDHHLARSYLPFAWNEVKYQGGVYGLPFETDARAVYYNKDILRQSGIDPALLDPRKGPVTIDTLMALAMKLNRSDADGNYTRLGLIPWDGEGEHATWALEFGARYYNQKTCQVTLTEPAIMQTYQNYARWARELNYQRVATFLATYLPPNAPPSQTPFYTGHLAISVDGNWNTTNLQNYAPTMNYGITYLPIAHRGDKPSTWSGGFAMVMPAGAPNVAGGYRLMRFMTGAQGQRIYNRVTGHLPTWASLYQDNRLFAGPQRFFQGLMKYSQSRPALPVGAQMWDAMTSAQQAVLIGNKTPAQALNEVQTRIQPQMQQYCPFKLK
ncbi:ABC transporter substrate-binding protein [Dictyobacter arantiisoli]|uniref:Sugar ABC transporter substrate-binding protein n=1 Tax=Dictyobacter arantiisoli TaxID=2014874 RepID=A0A5A5TAX0_9CHLR|nr:ABC transporter substrate-binding protein [Dictyobacter arantiisoli]GCF08572.1 sugar ABC transporter substrate-binding protein [Dictyobacter arantiisoli]